MVTRDHYWAVFAADILWDREEGPDARGISSRWKLGKAVPRLAGRGRGKKSNIGSHGSSGPR